MMSATNTQYQQAITLLDKLADDDRLSADEQKILKQLHHHVEEQDDEPVVLTPQLERYAYIALKVFDVCILTLSGGLVALPIGLAITVWQQSLEPMLVAMLIGMILGFLYGLFVAFTRKYTLPPQA